MGRQWRVLPIARSPSSAPSYRDQRVGLPGGHRNRTATPLPQSGVPAPVAVVISVCALLVPAPTASYTTVMVNGRRLVMSADASLTAAVVVLSIRLLPIFALSFDVGHVRDT